MNKRSVYYIFSTVLLVLLISFTIDKVFYFSFSEISKKVYTGQSIGKFNHFLKVKDSVDLLVFGSSRANHTISLKKITSKGFNIGIDGSRSATVNTLIQLLSNKPQLLLVHVDPKHVFNSSYTGSDVKSMNIFYNDNEVIKREINDLGFDNPFQIFYWSIGYNNRVLGITKNYIKPKYKYEDYDGFDGIKVSAKQHERLKLKIDQSQTVKNMKCPQVTHKNKIFMKMLDNLEQLQAYKNKKVVFFTAPLYSDDCKDDDESLTKILNTRGFSYINMTDLFHKNNDISYWRDETHVSEKGALVVTDTLISKIRTIPNLKDVYKLLNH